MSEIKIATCSLMQGSNAQSRQIQGSHAKPFTLGKVNDGNEIVHCLALLKEALPEDEYRKVLVLFLRLYARAKETAKHSARVCIISSNIGYRCNLSFEQSRDLSVSALLHDTGKVKLSDEILVGKTPLSSSQKAQIKKHPENGAALIVESGLLNAESIVEIVIGHHERIDGQGYPNGLGGSEIPLLARIISVADTFDAMTDSDRGYRKPLDKTSAQQKLWEARIEQLDCSVVKEFLSIEDL